MRVLVLGASGFLGGHVFKRLKAEEKFSVLGTCFENSRNNELTMLNINNSDEVKNLLTQFKAEVIIWTLMSRGNEQELIDKGLKNVLNNITPNQKLIFVSTNAVFSKREGNYSEEDMPAYDKNPNAIGLYGNAKIDGENLIKDHKNYIIIRPGAIYGQDVRGNWDKRISLLIDMIKSKQQVIRTKNLYNTFIKVEELADAILELTEKEFTGIIHLGPESRESYFDYFVKMAKSLELDESLITADYMDEAYAKLMGIGLDNSISTSKCRNIISVQFTNP